MFADWLIEKVHGQLELHRIDASVAWPLKPIQFRLGAASTVAEYKESLCLLFDKAGSLVREKLKITGDDPVIARVMELIETEFAEQLSLDYLAEKLNMSSAYLSVYIKEKTGTNFSEHVNRIRMAKAKELLSETSLNVNDISRQVGYHNITSFNRMFKKWTGLTPSEYRKQHMLEHQIR